MDVATNLGFSNGAVPVIPTYLSAPNGPACRGTDQSLTAVNPGFAAASIRDSVPGWTLQHPPSPCLRLADEFDCLAVLGKLNAGVYSFSHSREPPKKSLSVSLLRPVPHLVHRGPPGLEIGHPRVNNLEDVTMQSVRASLLSQRLHTNRPQRASTLEVKRDHPTAGLRVPA